VNVRRPAIGRFLLALPVVACVFPACHREPPAARERSDLAALVLSAPEAQRPDTKPPAAKPQAEAPPDSAALSVYSVRPFPNFAPELALGHGRNVTADHCGRCHSTAYITMQPALTRSQWQHVVNRMMGNLGASIPYEAKMEIIEYLSTNYSQVKHDPEVISSRGEERVADER
jgi:hypothetical protein